MDTKGINKKTFIPEEKALIISFRYSGSQQAHFKIKQGYSIYQIHETISKIKLEYGECMFSLNKVIVHRQ